MGRQVFTTGDDAKICRVAPRTISKWFDAGRIKGYRIPGSNDRRIPREALIRFLADHGMAGDANVARPDQIANAESMIDAVVPPEEDPDAIRQEVKARYPGMLCLFRDGDVWSAHGEDADVCRKVCGAAVWRGDIETVLRTLLRAGHRVAVCDQADYAPGSVERVVLPGRVDQEKS
jgi:hypothetical protein